MAMIGSKMPPNLRVSSALGIFNVAFNLLEWTTFFVFQRVSSLASRRRVRCWTRRCLRGGGAGVDGEL